MGSSVSKYLEKLTEKVNNAGHFGANAKQLEKVMSDREIMNAKGGLKVPKNKIQDIIDDEIIGIKSTSVKFKKNIKLFVAICYLLSSFLIFGLFYSQIGLNSFTFLFTVFVLTLMYQIIKFKKNNPMKCLQAFKVNNFSGFVLFLGIFLIS